MQRASWVLPVAFAAACAGDEGGPSAAPDTGGAVDTGGEPDPRFAELLAAMEADLAASEAPSISVAVLEGGELVFARAVGTRAADSDEPATADLLYEVGSITKMMTATTLLRRVDAGDVALDDPLSAVLPDLSFRLGPEWTDEITVRHLLTHTSGLADRVDWDASSDDAALAEATYGSFAWGEVRMAPAGAFWNYSNPNFSLAGLVAEEHDPGGRAWPDVVRDDVFRPLGMERCAARRSEVEADGRWAESWGITDLATGEMGPVSMDEVPDPAWARPAGLAWCTAAELARFGRFLYAGDEDVLPDDLRVELAGAQVDTLYGPEGAPLSYGFGVFVAPGFQDGSDYYRTPLLFHGGNTLSFSAALYALPEHDLVVAALAAGWAVDLSGTVLAALRLADGLPDPEDPPAYVVDPDRFDLHVGRYEDPWNVGEVRVERAGDELHVTVPLLDEYGIPYEEVLTPVSSDIFVLEVDGVDYDLTFVAAEEGAPSTWIRNRYFVAERADDAAAAPPPAGPPRLGGGRAAPRPAVPQAMR